MNGARLQKHINFRSVSGFHVSKRRFNCIFVASIAFSLIWLMQLWYKIYQFNHFCKHFINFSNSTNNLNASKRWKIITNYTFVGVSDHCYSQLRCAPSFSTYLSDNNFDETTMNSYFHFYAYGTWYVMKWLAQRCEMWWRICIFICMRCSSVGGCFVCVCVCASVNHFIYFSSHFLHHCKCKSITPFHFLFCILSVRSCFVLFVCIFYFFFPDKMTNKATPTSTFCHSCSYIDLFDGSQRK